MAATVTTAVAEGAAASAIAAKRRVTQIALFRKRMTPMESGQARLEVMKRWVNDQVDKTNGRKVVRKAKHRLPSKENMAEAWQEYLLKRSP